MLFRSQRAVAHTSLGEATVTVVGDDNKAALRVVKTDRAMGDQWLVSAGVSPGDKVIMVGIQSVRPGSVVHPHEVTADELKPVAAGSSQQPQK